MPQHHPRPFADDKALTNLAAVEIPYIVRGLLHNGPQGRVQGGHGGVQLGGGHLKGGEIRSVKLPGVFQQGGISSQTDRLNDTGDIADHIPPLLRSGEDLSGGNLGGVQNSDHGLFLTFPRHQSRCRQWDSTWRHSWVMRWFLNL